MFDKESKAPESGERRAMIQHLYITCFLAFVLAGCPGGDLHPTLTRKGKAQTHAASSGQNVDVTYIANEGVFIRSGEDQVLIDALHKPYGPAYLPTPREVETKIMKAEEPFNSIDVFLVSHVHGDHFDAPTVVQYLEAQQDVILFSSAQVIDSVLTHAGSTSRMNDHIETVPYAEGASKTLEKNGVKITAGKITHSSEQFRWVQNLGHVVEAGGLTFLHVGDPAFGRADIERLLTGQKRINIAILPAWFVTESEGREVIDEVIKPEGLIFVHVSPNETRSIKRAADRYYPGARVFTKPMEAVSFR